MTVGVTRRPETWALANEPEVVRARCAHLSAVELRIALYRLGVHPVDVTGPPNGLIVGEAPGPATHARLPMFPTPAGSAAGRLLALSGLTAGQYLGAFFRRNLFYSYTEVEKGWSVTAARAKAADVRRWISETGNLRVLLLGERVAAAFDVPVWTRTVEQIPGDVTVEFAAIPHPSGLNRAYNDPKSRAGAQAAVLWAGGFL